MDVKNHKAYVSTGHLPPQDEIKELVEEAHRRFKSDKEGKNSQVYPALAQVASELFGICVVGTNGEVHAVGNAEHEFSIMSVSKPFVFALVCQELGAEELRAKIGANATGLPFNSLSAVEGSATGRTTTGRATTGRTANFNQAANETDLTIDASAYAPALIADAKPVDAGEPGQGE